jgi:hypothetical protein
MNIVIKLASWLDRKACFGFRLWEFSVRNVVRLFPWYFLFRVLLPHPIKALNGFIKYRRLVRDSEGGLLHGSTEFAEIPHFFLQNNRNPYRFMIAPGFCMKPYDDILHKSTCPVGQFNHDCLVLENSGLLHNTRNNWPEPCRGCNVGSLAQLGAKLHADFYIMNSAKDIAKDIFLPAIRWNGVRLGVFLLCAYSTEPFTLGLTTSGIKGSLITFCSGDCLNHEDFTNADKGIKNKQTLVETSQLNHLKAVLSKMGNAMSHRDEKSFVYSKIHNVYRIENL